VSFNPVVISYAVVTTTGAHLFVDESKVTPAARTHLTGVQIHPYNEIESFLTTLAKTGSVAADPAQLNWRLYSALGTSAKDIVSPITLMKAIKNESEIRGIRESHIRDGVALTAFLHFLEKTVKSGGDNGSITEYEVTEKLEEFRSKVAKHVSPSFRYSSSIMYLCNFIHCDRLTYIINYYVYTYIYIHIYSTIAGFASNGAIIHYKPEKETAARLSTQGMFLLDSGAQYYDGTTDVTRTMHFGQPTEHMKTCYTLVLKVIYYIRILTCIFGILLYL
jgi:Xaa-Pro aminopeptidase